MKKAPVILILFFLLSVGSYAVSFHHLAIEDGLSSRTVFQLRKDTAGFMWFFTQAGIDRFDGTTFTHYTSIRSADENFSTLASAIQAFDQFGTPWLSLADGRIFAYHRETDDFTLQYSLADYTDNPINVNALFFDTDNNLWIYISSGLYLFDPSKNKLQLIADFPDLVTYLLQHDDKTYYIGTLKHLYKLTKEEGADSFKLPERIALPSETRIESLLAVGDALYIGTFSDGLYRKDQVKGLIQRMPHIPAGTPIRAMALTANGDLMVGADGAGLYRLDTQSDELIRKYTANEDQISALSGNTVSDIFIDERDCMWISTSTNGVNILDERQPEVEWVRHEYMNRNSLVSNHVNVILEDSDGDMWYGTNNGISLHRVKTNQWTHFLDGKTGGSLHPVVVLALCEDKNHHIWVGGFGTGTYRINKQTGSIHPIKKRIDENMREGVSTDYIYSIYADDDAIWLGGINGALTRYDIQTGEYDYYPELNCIGDIKSGDRQHLLMATCGGLATFNKKTGEMDVRDQFNGITLRYPIRCIAQTINGEVWMATSGNGLIRFHPQTNQATIYTTENGLASNTILSILDDKNGRIWFTTEQNIYSLHLQTGVIVDMKDYIQADWAYYNPNACFTKKNGDLAFGSTTGIVAFSSRFQINKKVPVQLLFTTFSLSHQPVRVGDGDSPLKQVIDQTQVIRLKYVQNEFSIGFSALNLINPFQIGYTYLLEGYETNWHEADEERLAHYTNLSPGKYVFKVQAMNRFSKEILDERMLIIEIGKPFWATYWAIGIYLLCCCGLILFILHYLRNRIEEHNSKEKIRSFIHLAHDIRIPITLIKAPLGELEEHESLSVEGRKSLSIAITNADKLLGMVTQLLDLQKADSLSNQMHFTRQHPYEYMQEKVASFRRAAMLKGICLQMEGDPSFPDVWFDSDSMDKIIDNILSNAIKYTERGTVLLFLQHTGQEWSVTIKDSGIGIPFNDQKHLFKEFYRAGNAINSSESGSGIGLVLVKKLVELNYGRISFTSMECSGSSFKITFPIREPDADSVPINSLEATPGLELIACMPTEKETILLAEDDDDMRAYLLDRLSKEYHVIATKDGNEAFEQAKEMNPDIVISDMLMPTLRGDTMCRKLKSSMETSHIPVILLTALNEKENIILGLEAGADDYVTKPFDLSVLKARIRNILASREKLRRMILSAETGLEELNYANTLDKEFLDKAIHIIEAELANPDFSINDFCRELGMSRTSAYNKIKTLTNQAPNDFIRIIRLNRAKDLLRSKKYPIAEVALMAGFSDPKYFSTSFKKRFGISPSKVE